MTTDAYLMTRGTPRMKDYAFLGVTPAARWWDRVVPFVIMESAEVVVACHADGVGVLVSGIPSTRRDAVGTPIRYTIVVDDLRDRTSLLRRIVTAGLDPQSRSLLGKRLDTTFGADRIDAIMSGGDDGEDVPQRVLDILTDFPVEPPEPGRDQAGSWVGAVPDPGARRAFLARVDRLAAGKETGFAFTSQALSTELGAGEAAERLGCPVAILLVDGEVKKLLPLRREDPQRDVHGGGPSRGKVPALRWERLPLTLVLLLTATAILWFLVQFAL
jgi:hypothetical protein